MVKIGKKIELKHNAERGYGTCDRLYINIDAKIYKAVDIGVAFNAYQDSVHPDPDVKFEGIVDYLKTIPENVIEEFMEKYANYSCCNIYPLLAFKKMREEIENILLKKE